MQNSGINLWWNKPVRALNAWSKIVNSVSSLVHFYVAILGKYSHMQVPLHPWAIHNFFESL